MVWACLLLGWALPCQSAGCRVIPQWLPIGPGPLVINPPDGADGQGPDSGMVRDIAIDPSGSTDQIIYIGTDSGGVWKTLDGGNTWLPKTDFMPSLNIGAVALDPSTPSTVYAGTGNAANQFSSIGAGIYKSFDGGESWTVLGAGLFTGQNINRIVVPYSDLLLVGCPSGVYRSIDGGTNFGNNPPLFNNTLPVLGGSVTDLDIDPGSVTTIYASVSGVGIIKSMDGGVSFLPANNIFTPNNGGAAAPNYITFAQSTSPNNLTMYVQAQYYVTNVGVFKSADGGNSWNSVNLTEGDIETAERGYAQTIGVDPQDANRVYIGARALYMATDGGAGGISAANRIDLAKVHADQHALVFSPPSHFAGPAPTRVYNGTDGGIATTANPGPNATWTLLNGSVTCSPANGSLATVLFRQIDMGRGSPANNLYTYGVAQDLGLSAHQPGCAGTTWQLGNGGDGIAIAVDPLNGQHAFGTCNAPLGSGGFRTTVNGGSSWQSISAGLPQTPDLLYFDPSGGIIYASVTNLQQLYQSQDNGTSFTLMNTFPAGVTAMSMSKNDPNTVWVGLADGTVQRCADALAGSRSQWLVRPIFGSPNSAVNVIAADPSSSDTAVVIYRTTGLGAFLTGDKGTNWIALSSRLNGRPLNAVVIDPNTTPHTIIVGTDTGVLSTTDLGVNWVPVGTDLPNVHCTSLVLDAGVVPSLLRVGTYGRSALELAYDRIYVDLRSTVSTPDGTISNPFPKVLQGLAAPGTGAARFINIQTGDYPEGPMTITQCATLNAAYGFVTLH